MVAINFLHSEPGPSSTVMCDANVGRKDYGFEIKTLSTLCGSKVPEYVPFRVVEISRCIGVAKVYHLCGAIPSPTIICSARSGVELDAYTRHRTSSKPPPAT
jgi:hypothetical protein